MEQTSFTGALTQESIFERLNKDLFIRPLLDKEQFGEVSIDFRLGYDFLVATHGREAYMDTSKNNIHSSQRNIYHFFQASRRQLGETFILHPQQTILATSLEYIKLPNDLFLMLFLRSSYARLGLTVSTIVQPGYCGCISIELTNNNLTPINLTVGARILQALVMPTHVSTNYYNKDRKYLCNVRPEPSAAMDDKDLEILNTLWKISNHLD